MEEFYARKKSVSKMRETIEASVTLMNLIVEDIVVGVRHTLSVTIVTRTAAEARVSSLTATRSSMAAWTDRGVGHWRYGRAPYAGCPGSRRTYPAAALWRPLDHFQSSELAIARNEQSQLDSRPPTRFSPSQRRCQIRRRNSLWSFSLFFPPNKTNSVFFGPRPRAESRQRDGRGRRRRCYEDGHCFWRDLEASMMDHVKSAA